MTILVTGATGTVGRQIVEQLVAQGAKVRALTRNPAHANFPAGVEVVQGDLTQPETLRPALAGVSALHLITFDSGNNYQPLPTAPAIMALAQQASVQHVTVLLGGEKGPVEAAVEASGIAWTYLQPVEFMANMLSWAESIRTEGVVREPFANRLTALVHEADIAAVATKVLCAEDHAPHAGQTYTLTGPAALTPPQLVATLAQAIGRDLQFIELSEAQARARWRAEGFGDEAIEYFVWMYGSTPEIGYTVVPTIKQVTGNPPHTFAQWAAEHAAAFRA